MTKPKKKSKTKSYGILYMPPQSGGTNIVYIDAVDLSDAMKRAYEVVECDSDILEVFLDKN